MVNCTLPVGVPVELGVVSLTVAEYVIVCPLATEPGAAVTVVDVDAFDTVSGVVPDDPLKDGSPPYVAVTVSLPTGALLAEHDPVAELNVTVHRVVAPTAKVTVPLGVPGDAELTVAEKVTDCPNTELPVLVIGVVVVAAGAADAGTAVTATPPPTMTNNAVADARMRLRMSARYAAAAPVRATTTNSL